VRWWPLWRPRVKDNGEAAAVAKLEAEDQHAQALDRTPHVDQTVRNADAAVRRADRFASEVARSFRLRRGPT
jgi:hypothetical protein